MREGGEFNRENTSFKREVSSGNRCETRRAVNSMLLDSTDIKHANHYFNCESVQNPVNAIAKELPFLDVGRCLGDLISGGWYGPSRSSDYAELWR